MKRKNSYKRKNINYSITDIFEIYFNSYNSNGKDEKNTFKTRTINNKSRKSITPSNITNNYFTYKNDQNKNNSFPFACADFFALIYKYYYQSPECNFYKLKINQTRKYDTQPLSFRNLNNKIIKSIDEEYKKTTRKILSLEPSYIFVENTINYIPKISDAINQILISLFNMDEASSDITYNLVLNKLYSIIDLLNDRSSYSDKNEGNTNRYYSLLNAFLNGFDYAKELTLDENALKSQGLTSDKDIDDFLSKNIPERVTVNYYDELKKNIYNCVFVPLLSDVISTPSNKFAYGYDFQKLINWLYTYGVKYDVDNLLKTITETINVLNEFVSIYCNLRFEFLSYVSVSCPYFSDSFLIDYTENAM